MIGVFGGAFDPIHKAHEKIINYALNTLNYTKIIIVPSYHSPHKEDGGMLSYEGRVDLINCLYKNEKRVIVDDLEKTLPAPKSYTYIVLEELIKKYPNEQLVFIVGGDSALMFDSWMKPERICELAPIIVFPRKGHVGLETKINDIKTKYNADIKIADLDLPDCSSSEIKVILQTGCLNVDNDLDKCVIGRIVENGYYMNYRCMANQLKIEIGESRYEHSVRTALFGVKLAPILKITFEDAFLACLLHDCGKNIKETYGCEKNNCSPSILHQYVGAIHAKIKYKIDKEFIVDAIRWHATGKPNMTPLGQLVYCADKLETQRDFEEIEQIRNEIFKSFDNAFLKLLKSNLDYLNKNSQNVDILTLETYKWYNNQKNID